MTEQKEARLLEAVKQDWCQPDMLLQVSAAIASICEWLHGIAAFLKVKSLVNEIREEGGSTPFDKTEWLKFKTHYLIEVQI